PEILDQHVGFPDQSAYHRLPRRHVSIDRKAALVAAVGGEEARGGPLEEPRAIALDRLDLDDVGTEVCENHSAGRTHHHLAELDDANAVQRPECELSGSIVKRRAAHQAALRNTLGMPASCRCPVSCPAGMCCSRIARVSISFRRSMPVDSPISSSM